MRIGLFELSKGVIRGYSFNQCVKYKHFQSLSISSLVNLNLAFPLSCMIILTPCASRLLDTLPLNALS